MPTSWIIVIWLVFIRTSGFDPQSKSHQTFFLLYAVPHRLHVVSNCMNNWRYMYDVLVQHIIQNKKKKYCGIQSQYQENKILCH
jgi:hypothetical protein